MSEVTIYCPPTGTTITGECYTTEVLSWTGDSVSYIQFFVPTIDDTLIKFDLTNITNNGSNVELDLVYWVDGVYGVVQSWNLGTISSSTYLYHYLDFGTTLGLNNYITLQFNIIGGTTGQIDITLECDVDVAKELFCSGTTFTEACNCENEVTLYTDTNQTSLFQFQGMSWYLDANLQTEAPCGNYVPKKLDSSLNLKNRYINYYYDCVTHLPIIYGYCTTPCSQIACSGGTSTYEHFGNTYAFANPLIETDKRLNSQTIVDPPLNFPNTNSFSKHCVTIEFPQGSNGIYSITIGYAGTSLPERYITFEDAAYYQTKQSPGQLSYNTILPSNSPWFIPIAADLLIPFTDTVTFYVIPPKSGLVTVKFMIGSSKRPFTKPSLVTTSITPSCTSVPIYKYNAGLHVYSAYDSIISPRLTTTVYSLTPLASWQVDSTKIFNDNYFVQPAFPYWYSISGTTYKVGEPLRRDWGAVHQYEVKKKLASRLRNVNVNKITGPYQNQIITDLFSGQRTLPSCIHILGTVGILREKVPQIEVIQPTKYKYFVGVSPFPNTTLIANKLASNDNYFTLIDAEFALSRDNCYPVTGFEHAAVKLGEAYSIMISPYLSNYIGANEFYQNLTKELKGSIIGRSNLIFGIAVSITILITVGFMSDQNAGYGNLGLFNGSGKSALDRYNELPEYKKGSTPESMKCPKWANGLPGVKESITYMFNNPKIALAIAVVIGIATFLQWFIPINKIVSECCKLLKVVNTNNPYIFIGDTIYLNQNMTTPFTSGWVCDGAYFYKIVDGAVLDKEISFTYHGVQYSPGGGIGLGTGPKVPSLIPDSPLYVTNITKLFFLPYVSGVPDGFTTNPLYSSAAISGKSFTDASVTGALYKPLENEYILEQGYFTSEISQLDADTKAINYFNTVTAQTQDVFGGLTYGPNIAYEPSIFSHEIKIENSPRQLDLFFDNTDLSGITIGKTVYLDLGYSEALTGYYSLSSDTLYRKFCLVLSGSVTDIYSMESASSTTVTSLLSGNTVNISQTYKNFTSGWYKKAFQPINNTLLKTPWNSSGFYSSDEITRGFVNTTSSAETFYTYSTKNGLASAFTEAESSYYQEIMAVQEQFFYYQPRTLIIDSVQVCSFTGSGVDFRVKDISGQTTNAEFGISFNAVIYTASTYDSTHSISIQSGEESKLLVLPFEYNGQITDVVISGYTSPNPVNKITYTAGTFTSCVTPSPTPTPTITSTQTPTPTITSTITPTPTITPTITTTPAPPFVSTWRTTGFSESITLPYWSASTSYDGIIDWGDGTQVSNSFANRTHTYTNPGDYEVKIYGTVSGWTFGQYPGNSVSKDNIISISQWGPLRLGRTATREFFQCTNLSLSGVTDVLDLTGKLYLFQTFTLSYGSITTIGRINEWNTSSIINMRDCFRYTSFNDDITTWDVSNNQAFTYMVADTPFNQDISGWNVSKGILFNGMFSNTPFNYNISSWNVSGATNMDSMFFNNTVFNQDISVWNVSNVTNMRFLFGGAQSFNQPVGVWNVAKVTNMYGMFNNAFNFNQDLSSWNTSKVTNMAYMFSQATDFDRNIGNWNVSGVTNFIDFMALKTDSDFSFTNLDSIYNGWSSQNVKTGITINFGTIKFSQNGLAGKQVLTGSPYNWIITDGGMIDFTPTPTPTITETMTPTPTITETMTPTPTPTEQVPTIYLNFCYDANIPEDFAVDVYVYSQTTPSGCGQNQTQVQEVLNITTTIVSDSGFSEGYVFTLNPGESCALTSGFVVGSLIDNFIVDSVTPTGSTFANYVVGQICSSGSCISCSGSTPTPTPTQTSTPTPSVTETSTPTPSVTETSTPTPSVTETPTPTPTTTTAELATPTPTPTPTTTTSIPTLNMVISGIYGTSSLTIDLDITGGVTPDSATLAFDWCTNTGQIGNATYNINAAEDGTLQIPNINLSSTGSDSQFTAWGSYSYSVTTANLNNPTQLYIETSTLTYTTSDTTTRVVVDFVGVDNSCLNNQNYSDYCLKNCSY